MSDTAAHLVDRVFPKVPVRQYVLSLPFVLRTRLAFDHALCSDVLRIFMQSVFTSLRRRARKRLKATPTRYAWSSPAALQNHTYRAPDVTACVSYASYVS